ncbi:MAG: signal peptidase II [Planctomycetota bacterium]|nr:signal peptidase II [Planctomycetota bacterium]MDI6788300.1 signal peptidase II [Planctomycetota bacterium]
MPVSVSNVKNLWKNTDVTRWFIFFSVAILGVISDLITKHLTCSVTPFDIIPGVLGVKSVRNPGIIWGLFQEGSVVFLIMPALAVPLIIVMFKYSHLFTGEQVIKTMEGENALPQSTKRYVILSISFGLILAGAIGNLYDRIVYKAVRDFIDFHLINWPIFNLADTYITIGAILIIISMLREPKKVPVPPAGD